jgi:hypothetical protein
VFEISNEMQRVLSESGFAEDSSAMCGVYRELDSIDYPVTGKNTGKFYKFSQLIEIQLA